MDATCISSFFCVKYRTGEEGFDILMLVGEYDLKFTVKPDVNTDGAGMLVVYGDNTPEKILVGEFPDEVHEYHASNFRLAEMAFQMNYKQVGYLCSVCEEDGIKGACGHLTFDGKI